MRTVKTSYGHSMMVCPDDYIGGKIIKKGIYDERGLALIVSLLEGIRARNVLDVGANIGNHALVYSRFSKHVWCFEPNSEAYDLLVKNIANNRIENISAYQFGLSDQETEGTLYIDESGNLGASTLRKESRAAEREYSTRAVSLRMGDKWAHEHAVEEIDFIKLDVEGHEPSAIRGLTDVIKKNRPFLLMEWSDESSDKEGINNSRLFDVFENYSVYGVFLNTDREYWKSKPFGGLRRFFTKLTGKKLWCTRFSPDSRLKISDLLLVPNERGLPANLTGKVV